MPRFKSTVSTVVSYVASVDADTPEEAEEIALKRAKTFSGYFHPLAHLRDHVDFNEEWQYGDPETTEESGR